MTMSISSALRQRLIDTVLIEGAKPGGFMVNCPECNTVITEWRAVGMALFGRCPGCERDVMAPLGEYLLSGD